MFRIIKTHLILLLALAFVAPVFADSDPTLHQVYEAARTGQLEQAQQMMNQVLRDHPKSAKAHYVAAELYAKQGNSSLARQQLNVAQSLEPGLPFAKPEAVKRCKENSQAQPVRGVSPVPAAFHARHFHGSRCCWCSPVSASSGFPLSVDGTRPPSIRSIQRV